MYEESGSHHLSGKVQDQATQWNFIDALSCMPCLPSPHRVTVQHGAPEARPGVGDSSGQKAVSGGWEVITGGEKEGKNCLTKVHKSLAFQGRTKCPGQRKGLWGQEPFILNRMDAKVQDQATHGSHSLSLGPVVPPGSCEVSKILPRRMSFSVPPTFHLKVASRAFLLLTQLIIAELVTMAKG